MWWKLFFVVFAAVVVQHVFKLIEFQEPFAHVHRHQPGPCSLVPGLENGSENMVALPTGEVFITSGIINKQGRIMFLNLSSTEKAAKPLRITGDFDRDDFRPHGISISQGTNNDTVYLYVVNHPTKGERIEKFRFHPQAGLLEFITSFTSTDMLCLNDVHVVGEDQFYYTNWHYFTGGLGWWVEDFLLLRWGSVVYFDGSQHRRILTELLPDGINGSPDGRYLYLAEGSDRGGLRVYTMDPDRTLTLHNSVQLMSLPDDVTVDHVTGDVYVGCLTSMWQVKRHLTDPYNIPVSSRILRLKMKDGFAEDVEEIFTDDGSTISAASVALYQREELLIGTIGHKMLRCQVRYML